MKKFIIPLVLLFLSVSGNTQGKRDYIWMFGGNRNPTNDTSYWRFKLDFNLKPPTFNISHEEAPLTQNNASICDKDGALLMYTSGCWISDRLFRPMPNGIINQGEFHNLYCNSGDYLVPFGSLFLFFDDDKQYTLIHKFAEIVQDSLSILSTTKLLYSKVNMTLNGGYGDVVEKNLVAIDRYLSASDLTAVRHSNGTDWWVLSPGRANNSYYVVLFTAQGSQSYREQKIGIPFSRFDDGGSQSCFSPDGTKYARMTPSNGLFVMDFDRSTGILSNFRNVITGTETADHSVGVAFSPDSRMIYLSYRFDLFQVESDAIDPQSTLVHIDHWDGYVERRIWAAGFNTAMLGPDCKIYICTGTSNTVMHVIHQPNLKGKSCNFQQHGIQLPARNHASIPNFVNYRLGHEPVCDSSLVVFSEDHEMKAGIWLEPNPVTDRFKIHINSQNAKPQQIDVCNLQGKRIQSLKEASESFKYEYDISSWEKGIYIIRLLLQDGRQYAFKMIKV